MKNVLGKLLVMATVSVMTLGVSFEPEYTPNQSSEISIDNLSESESYEVNIVVDGDSIDVRDE
ncbi:MAG: hypothetical protein K5679_11580 [Lachnospiraceae bacterium]|nr:hypothetical protein [Lachnospiraceae bacterium]